jgi:hypothetical protein
MRELASIAWQAARLEREAFLRLEGRRSLLAGLALLFAVSLLVASVDAAAWTRARLEPQALWASRERLLGDLSELLWRSPLPPDVGPEVTRNLAAWFELQRQLQALPRPLGRQASVMLQGLGRVVLAPYRRLAVWLPYSLIVFALAKALGGRASLPQMLGACAFYVVPHLLQLLRPLPVIGPLAGWVALGWGAAIYVKATAVTNDLGTPQALLAAAMPALAALTVALGALGLALLVW